MSAEHQGDWREVVAREDRPTLRPLSANTIAMPAGLAWIHALALEWEAEASPVRNPKGLYEASLRK